MAHLPLLRKDTSPAESRQTPVIVAARAMVGNRVGASGIETY